MKRPLLTIIGINALTLAAVLIVLGIGVVRDPALAFIGTALLMYSLVFISIGYGLQHGVEPGLVGEAMAVASALVGDDELRIVRRGDKLIAVCRGEEAELGVPDILREEGIDAAEAVEVLARRHGLAARVAVRDGNGVLRVEYRGARRELLWRPRCLTPYSMIVLKAAAWLHGSAVLRGFSEEGDTVIVEAGWGG